MTSQPLTVRLNKDKDSDIIKFLEDKPQTYLVKLAIRRFMNDSDGVLTEIPTNKSKGSPDNVGGSVLGW